MKTWSTTTYVPAEGAHRYAGSIDSLDDVLQQRCRECGEGSWHANHQLVEQYVSDAVSGPGLFAMEASDNGGRTYASNQLRWVDVEDAKRWASGLALRWFGCTNIRVRACDDDGQPTGDTVHQTL